MTVRRTFMSTVPSLLLAAILVSPVAAQGVEHPVLEPGTFTMRLVYGGHMVGSAIFEVTEERGALVIRELTMIPGADVDAETVVVVDASTLAPRSVRTTGVMFEETADVSVRWTDGHLNGYSMFPRASGLPQGELRIDTVLSEGVLEWTTALLVIPSLPLRDRAVFSRTLFDSRNGRALNTSIRVDGRATISVPAGIFETFRVKVGGPPPDYVAYVSIEPPMRLIRIEDGRTPWVYERMP